MEIELKLNPSLMDNPDADLRYTIPEILSAESGHRIVDDGYDYDDDQNLLLFFSTNDISTSDIRQTLDKTLASLKIAPESVIWKIHADDDVEV